MFWFCCFSLALYSEKSPFLSQFVQKTRACSYRGFQCSSCSLYVILRHPSYPYQHKHFDCYLVIFKHFIAIVIMWLICLVLTKAEVFSNDPTALTYKARTDIKLDLLHERPWFSFPYPGDLSSEQSPCKSITMMLSMVSRSVGTTNISHWYSFWNAGSCHQLNN